LYRGISDFNPLNAELNPICHLLAFYGTHHILHINRIRGKNGYQSRISTVKNEKGDLVTNPHSNLARWRNHFSHQLNVHGLNSVRQAEIHTAEPLVPKTFEVEIITEKLNRHNSPDVDQIHTGLKQGAEQFTL
jgi:hypothetical protein